MRRKGWKLVMEGEREKERGSIDTREDGEYSILKLLRKREEDSRRDRND